MSDGKKTTFDCHEKACAFHSGIVTKLEELDKKVDFVFNMSEKSVNNARHDLERRLETMNEFRAQLLSQAATVVTKSELINLIEKLDLKSETTINRVDEKFELVITPFKKQIGSRIKEIEKQKSSEEGSLIWKNYILTVLISMAVALVVHFALKF